MDFMFFFVYFPKEIIVLQVGPMCHWLGPRNGVWMRGPSLLCVVHRPEFTAHLMYSGPCGSVLVRKSGSLTLLISVVAPRVIDILRQLNLDLLQ